MAVSKDRILNLINRLSDNDLELVTDLMERLTKDNTDYDYPLDDEPTSYEDLEAIKEADTAFEKGELVRLKDVEHELRS